jgi:hypothetical protein
VARKVHMGMGLIWTLESIVLSSYITGYHSEFKITNKKERAKKVIFKFKIKVAVGHAFS